MEITYHIHLSRTVMNSKTILRSYWLVLEIYFPINGTLHVSYISSISISCKFQNCSSNVGSFKVLLYITLKNHRLHYLIPFLLIFSFFFEGFIVTIINYLNLNKAHGQNMIRICKLAMYKTLKVFNESSLENGPFSKIKK